MKTFEEFILEAPTEAEAAKMAPGMDPARRRAALEKNARNQARRDTPITPANKVKRPPQKALPASRGAIQKAPTNALAKKFKSAIAATKPNQSSIVKTTSSGPSREAIGKSVSDNEARTKPTAGYMGAPDTSVNKRKKPKQSEYDKERERIAARKDSEKSFRRKALERAAKWGLGKLQKDRSEEGSGTSSALDTQGLEDTTDR